MTMNHLYFGDNLLVLRESIKDESMGLKFVKLRLKAGRVAMDCRSATSSIQLTQLQRGVAVGPDAVGVVLVQVGQPLVFGGGEF